MGYVRVSKEVQDVADTLIERFRGTGIDGREQDITSRLAQGIEDRLNGRGITCNVFRPRSEENRIGADMGVILEAQGDRAFRKAFLVQAKVAQCRSGRLIFDDRSRLASQCQRMLGITSDSFVFSYTREGIFTSPAFYITRHYVYRKSIGRFFSDFFKCYIGDHKICDIVEDPKRILKYVDTALYIKVLDWEVLRF